MISSSSTTGPEKSTKSRRLFSFEEARRIARGHGFDSKEEFLEYACPGAYQIPKDADVVWEEDWRGWDDFLGFCLSFQGEFISLVYPTNRVVHHVEYNIMHLIACIIYQSNKKEGRKVARALKGIETEECFLDLIKSKAIPNDDIASRLPYRPNLKYKNEWLGWDDFLMG